MHTRDWSNQAYQSSHCVAPRMYLRFKACFDEIADVSLLSLSLRLGDEMPWVGKGPDLRCGVNHFPSQLRDGCWSYQCTVLFLFLQLRKLVWMEPSSIFLSLNKTRSIRKLK